MIGAARRAWVRRRLTEAGADPRLLEYLGRSFTPRRRAPLEQVRFVVLDTETTGLDHAQDGLLSLAAVGVQGGAVHLADRLDVIFASPHVGGHAAASVHGLVRRDLAAGVEEAEGVLRFLAMVKDAVLVAHHAAFDTAVLSRVLVGLGAPPLANPVVDTAHLVRRLDGGPLVDAHRAREDRSLDALVARLGFEIPARHTAAGDTLATAYALLALLARARRRGITTLGDLLAR
ncbi:MAG: 3'-5' exonuclease [Deltaproteobacteria bacterium]|nr:3'-5' exonuclease [Deltaproteobacteria bacterium]